jgi:hypothetical protein
MMDQQLKGGSSADPWRRIKRRMMRWESVFLDVRIEQRQSGVSCPNSLCLQAVVVIEGAVV